MEKMARAYNERLRGTPNPEYSEARRIAEEQMGILEKMAASGRSVAIYLKSLKSVTLSELNALEGKKSVPTNKVSSASGGLTRLSELEIELFIALDTLINEGKALSQAIERETRFTAFLALLPLQSK